MPKATTLATCGPLRYDPVAQPGAWQRAGRRGGSSPRCGSLPYDVAAACCPTMTFPMRDDLHPHVRCGMTPWPARRLGGGSWPVVFLFFINHLPCVGLSSWQSRPCHAVYSCSLFINGTQQSHLHHRSGCRDGFKRQQRLQHVRERLCCVPRHTTK
jgi:hypothetical protein